VGEVVSGTSAGLYSFDGRDLPVELEEVREHVLVVQPSWSVMEISNALIDLGMFPIQDIPVHPKSAQDVLTVASLVLERLQEEHAPMPVPRLGLDMQRIHSEGCPS
jgi:hypothetical protein